MSSQTKNDQSQCSRPHVTTTYLFRTFLQCPTKAYLTNLGVLGERSEFTEWDCDLNENYIRKCRAHLVSNCRDNEYCIDTSFPQGFDNKNVRFLIDCVACSGDIESHLHAVERSSSAGGQNRNPYIPIRFVPSEKVTQEDKLLLAFDALALHSAASKQPCIGRIIHGSRLHSAVINLDAFIKRAGGMLDRLAVLINTDDPPRCMLNNHCSQCEFRSYCYERARAQDDLSLLSGMSEKERRKHNSNGIFTVTQLSYTFRPRKRSKGRKPRTTPYYHSLKALAIREKKIYVVGKPELIVTGTPVYLDVEGIPEQDFYYLVGLRFTKDGSLCRYSFWADDLSQEKEIWHDCERILSGIENPELIYYGSYETRFLRQMKRRYAASTQQEETVDHLIEASRNLLSVIYGQVYFPTYSNGLKDIATFLSFKWSAEDPSGVRSLLWRSKWEVTKDATWKRNLLTYNAEDCEAAQRIAETISTLIPESATSGSASTSTNIVHTDSLSRQGLYKWGKRDFSLPEFDFINRCAYWDYQRDRLYVRTNTSHKRGRKAISRRATVTYPVNKQIEPSCTVQCPHCGSPRIRRYGRHIKRSYDMRFGRAGVKRWVEKFVVNHYKCHHCGKTFPSDRHGTTRHPYGPELVAYAVYHVIDLGIPQAVLARHINTVFHYDVGQPAINKLKKRAAEFYLETYEAINCKIVGGDLVHVDETLVSIKGERAYVWVFTSLEEVLYVYSETREATVLNERLEGFKGVLVSDFYAAYESMDCPQQKCLVHLIRDLNDDLLKHPFNEELRALGHDFAGVLKPIVETIDRFGLRKRFLRKHKREAQRFLSNISRCEYKTEVALAYQKRFKKNAGTLFTFLDYDRVAWNNNNAEHAIKAFARLRHVVGGSCTDQAIRDYLILLSVCETCRYKGVSFLDFLRSGEKDIEGFARRKGSLRRVRNHGTESCAEIIQS